MSDFFRTLSLYLLLDASASMTGERMTTLRQGVGLLLRDLRDDPFLKEAARISVIAFGSHARRLTPPTPVDGFTLPPLPASGASSLLAGLLTLDDCASRDAYRPAAYERGDWRPAAAIFTDGVVTDADGLSTAARSLRQRLTLIGCPTVPDARTLYAVTDCVLSPALWTPGAFARRLSLLDAPAANAVAV